MTRNDPCYSCTLPDCDEKHPRCNVRLLANRFDKLSRDGQRHLATEQEREAAARLYHFWDLERKAEASEGGRPYRDIVRAQP